MNHNFFGLLLQEVGMAGTEMVVRSWCCWDGWIPSARGGAQYLKAALKNRLFNPQPRIKDPSRQAEEEVCHLNIAMLGTGFLMPSPELVTSLSCRVFFWQGSLVTLTFL